MWFFIALAAFFLLALSAVIDKYLLNKTRIVPVSFAFYISFFGPILGAILIIFEPNFYFPKEQLGVLLIGGAALFFGLYFMFLALAESEVSKTNPLIVSLTPVFVFALSLALGMEISTYGRLCGAAMVLIGGYFLSQVGQRSTRLNSKIWLLIVLSAIMWGFSNTYSKIAYDSISFVNGFIWLRAVTLLVAVLFITFSGQWNKIFDFKKKEPGQVGLKSAFGVLIIGQLAGSLGVLLLQFAINLGNVIIVTALNGLQFFFVIFLVYLFSKFWPEILKEDISRKFLIKKIIWSLVLFAGVALVLI